MTKPVFDILPRQTDKKFQTTLDFFADGLEEIVNFGTIILKWDLERTDGEDEILPGALFLRNFIEELDAISILMRRCAIDSCKSLLRTVIENFLYIEYICQSDMYNRSMSYLIWNTFNQINNLNQYIPETEKGEEFLKNCQKDRFLKNHKVFEIDKIKEFINVNKRFLEIDKYVSVKNEYYRTKNKLKNSPNWYSLYDGPRNLKELATRVGFPALYEVYYRNYSFSTHGNDIIQGRITISSEGIPQIFQIRFPGDAQSITHNSFNISIATFSTFCKVRIPEKEILFLEWFDTIKNIYSEIGKIEIDII